ncbi:unnamed protein product [Cyclocybe aegerita]|uniref:Epoxide hydrolase N-terminal domain-containing protein n=1 Tax=Cyclocybe aegerita TaxID=1973307 RepID=A0A8S0VSR4_CYCAE|nr:unnamed protein product [Cyclocybe aegerita]
MASLSLPGADRPFKIEVTDEQLDSLKRKLALTTFPDELEDAGRDYGAPLAELKRLVARWQNGYDWRKHEKELNDELPQFKKEIHVGGFGDLDIHFVHKTSEVEGAIPLLFVHGWPGSFIEVRKILPLLTQASPDHPSFHVVAFSLPGYGFSTAPKKKGFDIAQYAEVGNKLMLSLGYEEYVTQGGDWGAHITRKIALLYGGQNSKAWHSNFARWATSGSPPTLRTAPWVYLSSIFKKYTPAEVAGLKRTEWFEKEGRGYNLEQSTQPQTLGYSLADSASGLLAWIYEKLVNWTDGYPWEDDEVLTWVSIYWFSTAGPAASLRIYYEKIHGEDDSAQIPTIPQGVSYFPKELVVYPRAWTRTKYTVFEKEHESGGHFAAHEKPVELVTDLRNMFAKNGPAYGVVNDRKGY